MPIRFGLKQFLNPVFVETGLYKGKGVRQAMRAGFSKIYSIEIDQKWISRASAAMSRPINNGRLVLVHGDSGLVMPRVLSEIQGRCTFWLDAHAGKNNHPLLRELAAIKAHCRNDHTILIDDLRLFERWEIPEDKVVQLLREINPEYNISKLRGFRSQVDVLAATPPA